jgi:hypothetical protein
MALCTVATIGKAELSGILQVTNSTRKLSFDSLVIFIILLVTVPSQSQRSGRKPTTTITKSTLGRSVQVYVISTSGHATLGYERKTQHI